MAGEQFHHHKVTVSTTRGPLKFGVARLTEEIGYNCFAPLVKEMPYQDKMELVIELSPKSN